MAVLPVQAAEANRVLAMLAGGGAPGGPAPGVPGAPPGGPGGPGILPAGGAPAPTPTPAAMALGSAAQQLDGANPQGIATFMRQLSDTLAQLYLLGAVRMPNICEDVASMRKYAERIITTANRASQALGNVTPIMNSAGIGPLPNTGQSPAPDIAALMAAQQ